MTINYELAENIRSEISAKAVHSLGGYNSPAYKKLSKKAYSALHRDLKGYFKVNSYKNLSVKRYDEAINYIQGWTPGTNLRLEIKEMNNQIEFKMVN
ncbi:ORF6C domain-containing protein [Clostridioides mangenotii]|uniref:ORF6C domain-containing protein n=1 Tax=Metaclostridioides mangenotii TaxID=1540 RepID=UPI00214A28E9|nr:ORF6C domain-containing protein [Clostridioides mangenotii]MCR1953329.1 ORF6C domain-containing protein [Clostridioides mangenotii]